MAAEHWKDRALREALELLERAMAGKPWKRQARRMIRKLENGEY